MKLTDGVDTRPTEARLREAHMIIAALVARAGGTVTLSAKDLLAVHPRDVLVTMNEPSAAFTGRGVTIRLERAPAPDETSEAYGRLFDAGLADLAETARRRDDLLASPPAPPPLVDRDLDPDNTVLVEREGDVDAGLGEAPAPAAGAAKEEHGSNLGPLLAVDAVAFAEGQRRADALAGTPIIWTPIVPPHDARPAVVAGVDVGGAEHVESVADPAATGKPEPRSATDEMVLAIAAEGGETWWHERPPARGDLLRDLRDHRIGTYTGEEKTSWPPQFVVETVSGGTRWSIPARRCAMFVRLADELVTSARAQLGAAGRALAAAHSRIRELEADLGPLPERVEKIATAAIRVDDEVWTLPRPARHHVLANAWCDAHFRDGERGFLGDCDQGFVTSYQRFVDRHEAWTLAERAGQLLDRAPTGARGTLYSEDLW